MSNRPLSTSLVRCGFVVVTLLVPLTALSARADAAEQIVLPFDCNVAGGRVQVRPSGDQAYRIYGARRQDQYRACSEQNPDRCRSFLVQSFTMACGRERAAWSDVYAAISKVTDGRAFFNNDGRLYYRMGPREPQDSYPFPAPRHTMGVVEMPDGFAPMAGVDAIFTPLDSRVAELQEGPPPDAHAFRDGDVAAQPSFAPALTPKNDGKPKAVEPPELAEASKPIASPQAEPPKSQVILEPKPAEPKPLETASTNMPSAVAVETARPETKAPEAAAPLAPTILNNPAAREVETASQTETVVAAAEIPPPPQPSAASDAGASMEGPRVDAWGGTSGPGLSVPPLAFAILIAAATLAILLVILKKQAANPIVAGPMRVFIEPTLPGFDRASAEPARQALTVREDPGPPAVSAIAASTGMPITRDDALAFLGLSGGASDSVIRKVVEGLRQSWHPDLATDEADRAAREERIKSINAAAAILQRKSAA